MLSHLTFLLLLQNRMSRGLDRQNKQTCSFRPKFIVNLNIILYLKPIKAQNSSLLELLSEIWTLSHRTKRMFFFRNEKSFFLTYIHPFHQKNRSLLSFNFCRRSIRSGPGYLICRLAIKCKFNRSATTYITTKILSLSWQQMDD